MVFSGTIVEKEETAAIDTIRKYADTLTISNTKTTHIFENALPLYIQKRVGTIKEGTIREKLFFKYKNHHIFPISEMNELYFSVMSANGSDKVFETNHVDGCFFFLPFCDVYRAVLALKGNKSIITHFPTNNIHTNVLDNHINLLDNDYLVFDYNREPHYIYKSSKVEDDSMRVILKLHYIVCPAFLPSGVVIFYKWLHYTYNGFLRFLFIHSQMEGSLLGNGITNMTVWFCYFVNTVEYVRLQTPRVGNHIIHYTRKCGSYIIGMISWIDNTEKIGMALVAVFSFLYNLWNKK